MSPRAMTKPRFAIRDVDWRAAVPARRHVRRVLAAANCDPAKFEAPHSFDIRRHPNPTFPLGPAYISASDSSLRGRRPQLRLNVSSRAFRIYASHISGQIEWRRRLGIRALAEFAGKLVA